MPSEWYKKFKANEIDPYVNQFKIDQFPEYKSQEISQEELRKKFLDHANSIFQHYSEEKKPLGCLPNYLKGANLLDEFLSERGSYFRLLRFVPQYIFRKNVLKKETKFPGKFGKAISIAKKYNQLEDGNRPLLQATCDAEQDFLSMVVTYIDFAIADETKFDNLFLNRIFKLSKVNSELTIIKNRFQARVDRYEQRKSSDEHLIIPDQPEMKNSPEVKSEVSSISAEPVQRKLKNLDPFPTLFKKNLSRPGMPMQMLSLAEKLQFERADLQRAHKQCQNATARHQLESQLEEVNFKLSKLAASQQIDLSVETKNAPPLETKTEKTFETQRAQAYRVINLYLNDNAWFKNYGKKRAVELWQELSQCQTKLDLEQHIQSFMTTGKTRSDHNCLSFFRSWTLSSGTSETSLRGMFIKAFRP